MSIALSRYVVRVYVDAGRGPDLSTPLLAGFAKHFIPAHATSLADTQFTLIGGQVRHSVLNILAQLPVGHVGDVDQQVVSLLAMPTSDGKRVWSG